MSMNPKLARRRRDERFIKNCGRIARAIWGGELPPIGRVSAADYSRWQHAAGYSNLATTYGVSSRAERAGIRARHPQVLQAGRE
jgi:hypothetical protein